jgi:membrane protease YdiL (CAAX protease family)
MPPLPPGLKTLSYRNTRYLRLANLVLLCVGICFLMQKTSMSPANVGLHLHHWLKYLLTGISVGAIRVFAYPVLRKVRGLTWGPGFVKAGDFYVNGSPVYWVIATLIGCFAEELWRAFCLVGFLRAGHSPAFALLVTSVAFGLAHYSSGPLHFEFGSMSGHAISGVISGLLFLWSGSVIAPYADHIFGNSVVLIRTRMKNRDRNV